jgi:hypothetical protein
MTASPPVRSSAASWQMSWSVLSIHRLRVEPEA